MRARVTVHNLVSLDGSLDGFAADVGLYYELAAAIPHQAVLTGGATILAAAAIADARRRPGTRRRPAPAPGCRPGRGRRRAPVG